MKYLNYNYKKEGRRTAREQEPSNNIKGTVKTETAKLSTQVPTAFQKQGT